MLRALGAAVLFVLCTAFGKLRSEKYRHRQEIITSIIEDIRAMETDLRCERCTVSVLLGRLASSGRLRTFWRDMLAGMDSGFAFGGAFTRSRRLLYGAEAEELAILDDFAQKFGTGDADTELGRLARAIGRLELIEKRLKNEYPKRIKLAGTLSMLCGVACALLVL